jgi:hypothetical protein
MTLVAVELIDCGATPKRLPRRISLLPWRLLVTLCIWATILAITGSFLFASFLVSGLAAILVIGSNLKHRLLGEPLVFSDFAVFGAMLKFPALYLYAVPVWARAVLVVVAVAFVAGFTASLSFAWQPHVAGLLLATLAALALRFGTSHLMRRPDLINDVRRHGLFLTSVIYWRHWLTLPPPEPTRSVLPHAPQLIIVQCESFADPQELWPDAPPLQGLARARAMAAQHGRLLVTAFGAYTMRAEHGVLCGQDEETLGFRRFDPFLTAARDAAGALPARLGHGGTFIHPYDLRFFNRHRLMRAFGFTRLISQPDFHHDGVHYVTDAAVGCMIEAHLDDKFIYAVTMENHGPWPAGREGYMHHLRSGDALLSRLIDGLQAQNRPAILVFFGDHRPCIPGVVEPGGDLFTPYVVLRFGSARQPGRELDLTPAELHETILAMAAQTVKKLELVGKGASREGAPIKD